MITTHDLREALHAQEMHAPHETDILAGLECRSRPDHRSKLWVPSLLAAAAVVTIVGLTALTGAPTAAPAHPNPTTGPALAASPSPTMPTSPPPPTPDPATTNSGTAAVNTADAAAARAAAEAAAAAGSAAASAQSARRVGANKVASCQTRLLGLRITVDGTAAGAVNDGIVKRAARDCAAVLGGTGDLNITWVDTTLQRFRRTIGATDARPDTRVVIAQITGRFDSPFGDGNRPISMLLVLDPANKMPGGVQIPVTNPTGGAIDLSLAGAIHH